MRNITLVLGSTGREGRCTVYPCEEGVGSSIGMIWLYRLDMGRTGVQYRLDLT